MSDRRVVVVTGGTGGIGSAVARSRASAGDLVFIAARTAEAVEAIAAEVGGEGRVVDATDGAAVGALLEEAAGRGRLAGLVHAVGSLSLRPAHLTSPADFREALEVNLVSAFHLIRAGVPLLRDAGGGSIVLFSSAAARTGIPNHEAIAAAKGGVTALARSAAATYAGWGIRVNTIAPGLVDTPLAAGILKSEKARERSRAMHPLGRLGRPDDVAATASWLLEDESWVTGQEIGVDGGLARLRTG